MAKDDIVVYSTHTCGYCHALMNWFNDNKVEHTVKYVDTDMTAQKEMFEKLNGNFQGVPVTIINDKDIVVGFDRNSIEEILRQKGVELSSSPF